MLEPCPDAGTSIPFSRHSSTRRMAASARGAFVRPAMTSRMAFGVTPIDSAMASTVRPASMSEEMRVRQVMAPKLQNSVVQCNSILLQDSVTVPPMDTTVGDRVRMARQAKGLTMNELA